LPLAAPAMRAFTFDLRGKINLPLVSSQQYDTKTNDSGPSIHVSKLTLANRLLVSRTDRLTGWFCEAGAQKPNTMVRATAKPTASVTAVTFLRRTNTVTISEGICAIRRAASAGR
jgi:hypothetical protein